MGETAGILICRDRTLTMEHHERIVNAVRCGAEVILANPDFTHPEGENVRMETGAIWSAVSCQLETACSPVLVGKPETLLAEEALRMLGANRREVVFLGDNPDTDGLTAQRLGVKYFPAMMLVDPKQGSVRPLSYGFISQDDLAKQFLNVSEDFKPNF